jgi:hypothetical protein
MRVKGPGDFECAFFGWKQTVFVEQHGCYFTPRIFCVANLARLEVRPQINTFGRLKGIPSRGEDFASQDMIAMLSSSRLDFPESKEGS